MKKIMVFDVESDGLYGAVVYCSKNNKIYSDCNYPVETNFLDDVAKDIYKKGNSTCHIHLWI